MSVLALLLLLTAAGFLLVSLCGNVIYWYETLNTPEERIPSPRPGVYVCVRHYCATLISYILCNALVVAGPFLGKKPRSAAETGKSGASLPPVVLVHGLNNNAGAWFYIARALERRGYNVSTFSYWSLFTSMEDILRGFDRHVTAVSEAGGGAPVVVCHSLGGLLTRKWLDEYKSKDRLRGLITLGTPHGGSKMAVFALGALARSIRPDGALIASLRRAEALDGLPCVSLVSPEDEAVLPARSLLPPQGWKMVVTPPRGHFSMLISPLTARIVLEELESMATLPFREARAPDPERPT